MTAATADRQSRARRRADELRERADELPGAVCAACGGVVGEGQGVMTPVSPWVAEAAAWRHDDAAREKAGAVPIRGWTRRHDTCATTAGIVRQLVGVEVAPEVAGVAIIEVSRIRGSEILVQHRVGDPTMAKLDRKPRAWAHLADADLERLAAAVDRERRKGQPTRCASGACAWCGVSTSSGWRSSPEVWSDGHSAPLCRDCAVIWDRRARPTEREPLRAAALEALSGASTFGGDGLGLLAYVDVAGDDHSGHPVGWIYAATPLAELRERARLTWPESLPGELGTEYAALSAERQRAAREAAEREAAEAAEAERVAAGWTV